MRTVKKSNFDHLMYMKRSALPFCDHFFADSRAFDERLVPLKLSQQLEYI